MEFEKLPKVIIIKIAKYLKIKDRANMARCSKKLSVAAPDFNELHLVYCKLLKNTKRLQLLAESHFCRNCHDYSPYEPIICTACGLGICEECVYNRSTNQQEEMGLIDGRVCMFCEYKDKCSICDNSAIAACTQPKILFGTAALMNAISVMTKIEFFFLK